MAELDGLWDFGDAAGSESRFREWLQQPDLSTDQRAEALSQVARTYGLRRMFDLAHETLDEADSLAVGPRAKGRIELERGRAFNSAGRKPEARSKFAEAAALFAEAGAEGLEVDALHMTAICADMAESVELNQAALLKARASSDPDAQRWVGSLLNNLGWSLFDLGRHEEALATFQEALAFRVASGKRIPEARWAVARVLREMGRVDESLALQLENITEENDGYVHEELALLYRAKARSHALRATELLTPDDVTEDRLAALKMIAE